MDSKITVPPGVAALLAPALALHFWTFAIEVWMGLGRIPHVAQMKNPPTSKTSRRQFDDMMPAYVRWRGDNYINLFEQPTTFYSVIGFLALLGATDKTNVRLAWLYFALRVGHSLVHTLTNILPIRFLFFASSSAVVGALTARTALLLR